MAVRDEPLFSLAELDTAGGLPLRTLELLVNKKLIPPPARPAVRGGRPYWDEDVLARVAVIGAIYGSAPSLMLSARLGNAIVDEYTSQDGRLPTLFTYYRGFKSELTSEHQSEQGNTIEYFAHRELRQHPNVYQPGEAKRGDTRVVIVDRRYVFTASVVLPFLPRKGAPRPVAPEFVINGWGRSPAEETITVESFATILPKDWWEDENRDEADAIQEIALKAWDNATSLLMINVSLAIRQAYDRIYDRRHGISSAGDAPVDTS